VLTPPPPQIQEEIYFIHTDHLDTPRCLTDSGGQLIWQLNKLPFGGSMPDEDVDGDGIEITFNIRFPGQYYDQETGLHYNYFRYYDPSTGRYITSDPVGLQGGLNTYEYVKNNPLVGIDPYGLWTWPSPNDVASYWGEAIGGAGDFLGNYRGMRAAGWKGADKYFHCKANCEAAQRGPGGEDAACAISDTREWWDQNIKGYPASDSAADQIANRHGRGLGAVNPSTPCSIICKQFRPAGLPAKY
jgi:RHS repeat-associated protein